MRKGGSRNSDKDDRSRIISSDRRQTAYDRPAPPRRSSSNAEQPRRDGEHHYETPRTVVYQESTPRNSTPTITDTTRDDSHFQTSTRAMATYRRTGNTALSEVPEDEVGHDAHRDGQVPRPPEGAPSITGLSTMTTRTTTDIRSSSSLPDNTTIYNLSTSASAFVRIALGDFLACRNMVLHCPDVVREDMKKYEIAAKQLYSQREDATADQCLQRYLLVRHCQTERLNMQEIDRYLVKLSEKRTTYQNHMADLHNVRALVIEQTKAARAARNPQSAYPMAQSRPITIPPQGRTDTRHASSPYGSSSMQSDFLASDMQKLSIGQNHGNPPKDQTQVGISNSMDSKTMSSSQTMASAPPLASTYRLRLDSFSSSRPSGLNPPSYGVSLSSQNPPPSMVNVNFTSGLGNPNSQAHDFATGVTTNASAHMPGVTRPLVSGHTSLVRSTSAATTAGDDDDQPHEINLMIRDDDTITLPDDIPPLVRGQQTKQYAGFNIKSPNKAAPFFVVGRVFKIWWASPAGSDLVQQTNPSMNANPGNGTKKSSNPESINFKPRLMLVVQAKHGYCICCPIASYGGKGLKKFKHNNTQSLQEIRAHAVIYTRGAGVVLLQDEPKMGKRPIAVNMVKGQPDLDAASRVHFGKFHTVEWNVHVKGIGMVDEDSIDDVENYFQAEALPAVQNRAHHAAGRAPGGPRR